MAGALQGRLQGRGTLRGIALTLLALALLAERTAGRSFPVRFLVLAILSRAEAIARAFVAREIEADCPDLAWPDWPRLDEPLPMRGGAADAEILALRLRMLAAVLGDLADADPGSDGWTPHPDVAPRLPALLVVRLPARRIRRPYDTS